MDDDIQDILDSVAAPSIRPRTLDLQALTRAWINERTAPDLLPYPADLIDLTTARIKAQIETIEHLTGTTDPQANFTLVILQTDLERCKFLVRSFLRARLAKIDRYPHHYRDLVRRAPRPDRRLLLSGLEQQYLQSHQSLLGRHYQASFLAAFPAPMRGLEERAGNVSMVDVPEELGAVFVRVLRDAGRVEVQGEAGVGVVELKRGDVWVLRWRDVRGGVERGDVELI